MFCAASAAVRADRSIPETGELLHREFDKYLFVLSTEDLDLRDVRHLHQPRADILDVVTELAMGESVCGEAINDSENIAEFVVEPRADDAVRQSVAHIADTFANVIPDVGNLRWRVVSPFRLTKMVVNPGLV